MTLSCLRLFGLRPALSRHADIFIDARNSLVRSCKTGLMCSYFGIVHEYSAHSGDEKLGRNKQGVRTWRGSMLRRPKSFTISSRTESSPEARSTGCRHCGGTLASVIGGLASQALQRRLGIVYQANRVTKRDRKINGPPA